MAKILVVENDLVLGSLIMSALQEDGHEITDAENSCDAIQKARTVNTPFDLILTDLSVGAQAVGFLVRVNRATRVMVMSRKHSFIVGTRVAGSDDSVLQKPFTVDELRNRVRRVLAPRRKRRSRRSRESETTLETA